MLFLFFFDPDIVVVVLNFVTVELLPSISNALLFFFATSAAGLLFSPGLFIILCLDQEPPAGHAIGSTPFQRSSRSFAGV